MSWAESAGWAAEWWARTTRERTMQERTEAQAMNESTQTASPTSPAIPAAKVATRTPGTFEAGDIVRIVRQPSNQIAHVEGLCGFIEELQPDGFALVTALTMTGQHNGAGSVPLSCLGPEPSPMWRAAKDKFDARIEQNLKEEAARLVRFMEQADLVGKRHGVTGEKAAAIYHELHQLREQPR